MRMMTPSTRNGFTLVEFLVFLGIVALLGSAVVTMLVWTQNARLTQRTAADVEQTGVRLLTTMTRLARRAETILDPAAAASGSVLTLQMAGASEFPTIFAVNATGTLVMIQRDEITPLVTPSMRVLNLSFQNISADSARGVLFSFDLQTTIPTPSQPTYTKHFQGASTLFPDDLSEAGGCGTCAMTGCTSGTYHWSYCLYEVCTPQSTQLAC